MGSFEITTTVIIDHMHIYEKFKAENAGGRATLLNILGGAFYWCPPNSEYWGQDAKEIASHLQTNGRNFILALAAAAISQEGGEK